MSLKNYKENLKKTSGVSEKKVKVLEKDNASSKKARNINVPTAFSSEEKAWIETQAAELTKQLGLRITVSAFIRMKALSDMPKED